VSWASFTLPIWLGDLPCYAVGRSVVHMGLRTRQSASGAAFTGLACPSPRRGLKPLGGAVEGSRSSA